MRRFYTSIILFCVLLGVRLSAQTIPASQVYISEVMFDSPLEEDKYSPWEHNNGEYIKLYNPTTRAIDLSGWILYGYCATEQYKFPKGTFIQPDQSLVLSYSYNLDFDFRSYYHIPDYSDILSQNQNAIILYNKGEQLTLYNTSYQLIDVVLFSGNKQGAVPVSKYAKNLSTVSVDKIKSLHRKQISYKDGYVTTLGDEDLYSGLATPASGGTATIHNTTPNIPIIANDNLSNTSTKNDGTVGTLPGEFSVSSSGGSTYNIPIECPVGISGMQPNLSLVYNSQGGNGPLGAGFAISGLSAISRSTKNLYSDGVVAGLTFTSADVFNIDGNRLLWDGAKYVTEQKTFSQINSVGVIPNTDCPQSFIVTNKDGQTIEYGVTADSRMAPVGASVPMQWFINKTTDANGNYMTYKYESKGGQTVLTQIDYTGNGNKLPFASVIFNYPNDKITVKKAQIVDYTIEDRYLLDNIEIKSNGITLKQYNLGYKYDKENYYLTNIGLIGLNNQTLNPTTIEWGTNNAVVYVTQSKNSIPKANLFDGLFESYLTADVDGDGLSDMVKVTKCKTGIITGPLGTVSVYRNRGVSSNELFESTPSLSKNIGRDFISGSNRSIYQGLVAGSFNGNLKRSILIPTYNQIGNVKWVNFQDLSSKPIKYSDTQGVTGMNYDAEFTRSVNCTSAGYDSDYNWNPGGCEAYLDSTVDVYREKRDFTQRLSNSSKMTAFTVSDLNGDGIDEIISIEKNNNVDFEWIPKFNSQGDPDGDKLIIHSPGSYLGKIFYVKKSSYNREGFSPELGDKVIADDLNLETYDINIPSNNIGIELTEVPNIEIENIMAFDCNSDGLKDLVVLTKKGCIFYKNNGGIVGADGIAHITFSFVKNIAEFSSYFSKVNSGDFNGDGLMDFVAHKIVTPSESNFLGGLINTITGAVTGDVNNVKKNWVLAINNGNWGFDFHELPFTAEDENFTYRDDDKDDYITMDFNHDGKSDIVMIDSKYKRHADLSAEWGTFIQTDVIWYASTGKYGSSETGFNVIKSFATTDPDYTFSRNNLTGDFNGDGKEDLLTFGSNMYEKAPRADKFFLHTNFNDFETNSISLITNGLGEKTAIIYQALTNPKTPDGTPFYVKESNAVYPFIDMNAPMYCVKKVLQSDGIGGKSVNEYFYTGAKMHLTGKGFIGFSSNMVRNSTTNKKTISITEMDYGLILPTKQTTFNSTYNGNLISKSETSLLNTKVGRIYDSRPLKTTVTDYLTGLAKSTEISGYVDGNPTQIITINGSLTTTKDVIYGQFGSWAWCKNKPTKVTSTRTQNGQSDVRVTDFTYDATTGNQLTETADPEDINKLQTKYEDYDQFGRAKKVSIIANGKTRSSTVVYKLPTERFVESKTDQLDETTHYDWNETRGLLNSETVRNKTTSYTYDGFGQLTTSTFPIGVNSTTVLGWATAGNSYNARYYKKTVTDGSAPVTVWYDGMDRERAKETFGLNGKKISIFTEYNSDGSVYRVSEPTFNNSAEKWANTFSYDEYVRPRSVVTSFGTTINTAYNGTTTTVSSPETTKTSVLNSAGQIESVATNGKTVSFTYYASGSTKSSTPQYGQPISMEYDIRGNRTKLTDPDAGVVESKYNGFGELMWERQKVHNATDWVTTTNNYDVDGHGILQSITRGAETTIYTYDPVVKKKVTSISIANKHSQTFGYDQYDRVTSVIENIKGKSFTKSTKYDALGRVSEETYPSGYYTTNVYDAYSNLIEVKDKTNRSIWKAIEENARGQLTKISKGGKDTRSDYDDRGLPTAIYAAGVVDAGYSFDEKGNLMWRTDNLTSQREDFTYDGHNRLRSWIVQNGGITTTNTLDYDETTGNISKRSGLNNLTMTYGANGKPHALTSIEGKPHAISTNLDVTYTDFKKIASLSEGNKYYTLDYGVDDQRRMSVYTVGGSLKQTRYYLGDYEEETDATTGNVRKIHYLSGGAMLVDNNGVETLYYAYSDFQGSLIALTDVAGAVVEKYAYDPWGARRNPTDWSQKDNRTSWLTNRGYTGHEHLDAFGIINMNGRVYDPLTAMFMSPDPYVQAPDNWLNYNRYGYCYGNPFKYTDPSGNIPVILAVMAIFAYAGGSIANDDIRFWKWDYSKPETYLGIVGGAAVGLVGTMVVGAALQNSLLLKIGVDIGGYTKISADFAIVGGKFALQGIGYTTIAGGGVIISSAAAKEIYNMLTGNVKREDQGNNYPIFNSSGGFYGADLNFISEDAGYNSYLFGNINTQEKSYNRYKSRGFYWSNYPNDGQVLMHEYGHFLQERTYGPVYYYKNVVPTSGLHYGLSQVGLISENEYRHSWTEVEANTMSYYYFGKPSYWNKDMFPIDPNCLSISTRWNLLHHE
ncbi:MAG: lamin tail domain-containing protein [Bacteroidales bacterium]|nr:lamin tail domain-containing protein [Bacteroidales bacterium]